jgi:hypothetical protein
MKQRPPLLPLTCHMDAGQQTAICPECFRLVRAYQKSVTVFSTALEALQAARAATVKIEYQRMWGYVQEAKASAEEAREDLDKHTQEHENVLTAH